MRTGRRSGSAPSPRLAALPGVEAAAIADSRPPSESGQQNNFDLEDRPTPAGQNQPVCTWVGVSPEFFTTVGLRLERGRLLDEHSRRKTPSSSIARGRTGSSPARKSWAADSTTADARRVRGRRSSASSSNVKWIGLDAPAEDGTVYFPLVDLAKRVLRASRQGRAGVACAFAAAGGERARSRLGACRTWRRATS